MTTVSISLLKTTPAKIIQSADDYPVAIEKRNKIQAYILSKDFYEKLIRFIEDHIDHKTIASCDLKKGRDFEKVASELGI
jgi:PHD/YefM family antitoxin component YafN of YafNO toxin-antitoxin module